MAWAFVQPASNIPASGSGQTLAQAYGSAVGAGSLLVCAFTYGAIGDVAPSGVSDSVNGAWTLGIRTYDSGANQNLAIYYFLNSAAGTPTVTINWGANHAEYRGMILSEYSGIATASAVDGTPVGSVQGAGTTHTSSNVTVSQAGDLVFGFVIEDTAGAAGITSSNVTIHAGQAPTIANNVDIACGDKTGPASGTTSAAFTFDDSQGAIIQCICFKEAAGGGGASVVPVLMPQYRRRRL